MSRSTETISFSGERLKAKLKEKNITQVQLAEMIDYDKVSVNRMIRRNAALYQTIIKIAAKLDCSVGYLTGDSDEDYGFYSSYDEMISVIDSYDLFEKWIITAAPQIWKKVTVPSNNRPGEAYIYNYSLSDLEKDYDSIQKAFPEMYEDLLFDHFQHICLDAIEKEKSFLYMIKNAIENNDEEKLDDYMEMSIFNDFQTGLNFPRVPVRLPSELKKK